MSDLETSSIGRAITALIGVLAEVEDDLTAVDRAAVEYERQWRQVNAVLVAVPLDNPLQAYPTLWDWYARCQNDLRHASARHQHLEEVSALAVETVTLLEVGPPAFSIEMFERDGNPADAPYLRWFLGDLTKPKQLAAKAGVERILAYLGNAVVETEWGGNLQDGLCELRIRRTAAEVESWWRNYHGLPEPEPEPHVEILLRIYFHAYGDKVILLLGGFDKGAHPNHEKAEVRQARANLQNWRTQQERLRSR
jgi:hypothetical protein